MEWKIEPETKEAPKLNNPILIEGLPGIGNVGKIVADFIIEELKAKKLYSIFSYSMPHSVFVNDKNLVELPSISVYYKKFNSKKSDLLILAGDVQPIDEKSSYEFVEKILDMCQKFKVKEIITLGGIGLPTIPKKPKVYCTSNTKEIIKRYKSKNLSNELYGVVGPIIGVTGLLLGMGAKRKIPAISFLAETLGHPMYLGMRGAKEILEILNKNLELGINLKNFDKEVKEIESDIQEKSRRLRESSKKAIDKFRTRFGQKETTYIG